MEAMSLTLEELKPVFELLAASEERLCTKIDEAHDATMESIKVNMKAVTKEMGGIRRELKSHNGRLTKVESAAIAQITTCAVRGATCGKAMDNMIEVTQYTKVLAWLKKNWKMSIAGFIVTIIVVQVVVLVAVEHKWIGTLISFFKP